MPCYFFHLRNGGDLLLDAEGRTLDGIASIARMALMEARAIISADALGGRIELHQRIEVEDSAGKMVHRLDFEDAVQIAPSMAPATLGKGGS